MEFAIINVGLVVPRLMPFTLASVMYAFQSATTYSFLYSSALRLE